jgi:arylsulfatase A-like enzyme
VSPPVPSRVATLVVVAAAAWMAHRAGGSGDVRARPPARTVEPRPSSSAEDHAPPAVALGRAGLPRDARPEAGEAYEVVVRLSERLGEARIDAANLRTGQTALAEYWRKLQSPWTGLQGDRAKLVTDLALVTSGSEKQLAVPLGSGKVWLPDAKKWNMSEGSFDEREAIFAPPPSTLSFAIAVPPAARLSFAPALLAGREGAFAVSVVDATGVEHEVYSRHVGGADAKQWLEETVDMAPFGGQHVELRLKTTDLSPPGFAVPLMLWGHPALLARAKTRVPYNVLWIVIDALRPDVIPSFHDEAEDAAKLASAHPPLDALLPRVPGLMPSIDALAARGVRFEHAYSSGAWTRPGTLAMLAGERSSELGVDTLMWPLTVAETDRFYASDPPLLPLILRRQSVETRAFVNNFFMSGYAHVALDFGFERLDDERYRTADTTAITTDAVTWLRAHKDERFFAFCNYNSPHDPYDPPERLLARIPKPPAGPSDALVARYMAEGAKDDEAVGTLMQTLDELGLRERTLVVLTADHGETLSSAHQGQALLDKMPIRFHHAVGIYEETTRIPILLSLPGVLPEGTVVKERVRNVDLAPTVLELEGLEPSPKMSGASLVQLARGQREPDERVVVSEGRGTRAIYSGTFRLIVREGPAQSITYGDKETFVAEELYDLSTDPGERVNLAHARPDKVAEMRARLAAALKNVPAVDAHASTAPTSIAAAAAGGAVAAAGGQTPRLALRFAGGGEVRRVRGAIVVGDATTKADVRVTPVGLGRDSYRIEGGRVEVSLSTARDAIVGLDLLIEPVGAPVRWELFEDDVPWPAERVFAGPFGLAAPNLRQGITTDEARASAYAPVVPSIDPLRDTGLFVARERRAEPGAGTHEESAEATREMDRVLRDWGYAHGSGGKK